MKKINKFKDRLFFHVLTEHDKETDEFVALCLDLDIDSEGRPPEEALDNDRKSLSSRNMLLGLDLVSA